MIKDARKIIEEFGEEAVSIFKFEPMRLAEIKGISKGFSQEKAINALDIFNNEGEFLKELAFSLTKRQS